MPRTLILASGSPRRAKLLGLLDLSFRIEVPEISELRLDDENPDDLVRRLALLKAENIAANEHDAVVLGADTIVVVDNQVLEKPATEAAAFSMLSRLSARTHAVFTGIAILEKQGARQVRFVEKTEVTFGSISADEISHYISSGSPFDKAGGYGIQDDRGALFVESIDGDFYNVMGLPIFRVHQLLRSEFPDLFEIG